MDQHSLSYEMVSLYKGEGRILVIPYIHHHSGYSVFADWAISITDMENCLEVGKAIHKVVDYINNSPECTDYPGNTDFLKAIKENSKYTDEVLFFQNNLLTRVKVFEDNSYVLCSMKYSEEDNRGYSELVKEITLPPETSDKELGKAVLCAFEAAEE